MSLLRTGTKPLARVRISSVAASSATRILPALTRHATTGGPSAGDTSKAYDAKGKEKAPSMHQEREGMPIDRDNINAPSDNGGGSTKWIVGGVVVLVPVAYYFVNRSDSSGKSNR